jgi:hypothetical protein
MSSAVLDVLERGARRRIQSTKPPWTSVQRLRNHLASSPWKSGVPMSCPARLAAWPRHALERLSSPAVPASSAPHRSELLLDEGWEVYALDDLSTGSIGNVAELREKKAFHLVVDSVLSPAVGERARGRLTGAATAR